MKAKHNNRLNNTQERNGRALVIGGSVAGLSTARVLAQHFEQVTVLERDRLPEEAAFRAGIPQAHHAHTLLPYGQMLLRKDGSLVWLINSPRRRRNRHPSR